jgi:autotransporter-associated beta strand protein
MFDVANESDLLVAIRRVSTDFAQGIDTRPYVIGLSADITLTRSLPSIRTFSPGDGSASLIILGNSHTIDANNAGRVFVVTAGTVAIQDLRIANARAQGGHGGKASLGGAGGGGMGAGAAIFVNAGASVTTTSVIVENAAAVGGAGGGATIEALERGGAGGGGLNGDGGETEHSSSSLIVASDGGGGGGGYMGTGGSPQNIWTPDAGGGGGGGGEEGSGGTPMDTGGSGGGGYQGRGGDAKTSSGGGGGGHTANGNNGTSPGVPAAGGGLEGGIGTAQFTGAGGNGLALGGGGGGGRPNRGGDGGLFGGGGGSGDVGSTGGHGGDGGGGGGGGYGNRGGDGGEFGGGGGGGGSSTAGTGGQGGLGAGGGGGGQPYAAGGNGGFGGGGGGRPQSASNPAGTGGTFGGNGGRGGGGGAALGGAIYVHTGGSLTIAGGYDFVGTFQVTPGPGGQAVAPADNGADGQARGRVFHLTGGTGAIPITIDTSGGPHLIPGADAIAGDGGFVATGDDVLLIDGDNSNFTGTVLLKSNPGALRVGHDFALGSSALTVDSSRLGAGAAGPVTLANPIAMTGTGLTIDTLQPLTLSGPLTGDGTLVINSAGQTVTLSGANTFIGDTIVNAGTLSIDSASRLGTPTRLTVNPGATLNTTGLVDTSILIVLNNATITGGLTSRGTLISTGTLTKNGTGSLVLGGSAAFSNTHTLVLNGGSVQGSASTLPPVIVTAPATAVFLPPSGTYAGSISGGGGVSKFGSGPGTLTLTGTLTYTGTTSISTGTLRLSGGVSLPGNISNSGALEFDLPVDGTVGGRINGPGTMRKTGAGKLTLTGRTTLTGFAAVTGGALQFDGTSLGTNFAVASGGTLAGSGALYTVHALAGSTVAPGPLAGGVSGPGVLTAIALTLSPGATLAIDLNGPDAGTGFDRLVGNNFIDVTGATLQVRTGFTPAPGATFVIVTNVRGTFAGLPEGAIVQAGTRPFRITYVGGDGDDVALIAEDAPSITGLIDRTTAEDVVLGPLPFTVSDDLSPAAALIVSATSSNQTVVTNAGVAVGGSGAVRTLTITPVANASGTTTITVRVQDEAGLTTQRTFVVTVTPVNDAPTITAIPNQVTPEDVPTSVLPFVVDDVESPASTLTVSSSSTNTVLVPPASVTFGGSGATRTVTIAPAAGQSGTAVVTITVSDGEDTTSTSFTLLVIAKPTPPDTPEAPVYYLAEGATGAFFDTDLLLANPQTVDAPVTMEFLREDGITVTLHRTLAPLSRLTLHLDEVPGLEATTMSTRVVSTASVPIVVERTMWWDASGYGSHTEKASAGAVTEWLFAEGAQGFFSTFMLLVNPQATANVAHITWLRENEPALMRDYPLPPASRVTVDAGADAELVNRAFGARVVFDQPGAAERSMYFGTSPLWTGGTASAGATAPSTHWLLAEGATGSYFTTFVLIANPNEEATTLTLTYLPASGSPVTTTKTLAGRQRLTVNIATEDASLASAAVSTDVVSTLPVVVERAQYWPQPAWIEAHSSVGVTDAATTWGLAEGRVGGQRGEQTYILLANPGTQRADVTITFLRETGAPLVKTYTVAPSSRFNVAIAGPGSDVEELVDEFFGARLDSTQPIVVERSLYSNANGVTWAAGTNATATRLP